MRIQIVCRCQVVDVVVVVVVVDDIVVVVTVDQVEVYTYVSFNFVLHDNYSYLGYSLVHVG